MKYLSRFLRFRSLALVLPLPLACSSPSEPTEENLDADGDAVLDSLGKSVDKNGDRVADLWDANGDGTLDGVGIDTNGDGDPDAIGLDSDGDGVIDRLDPNFSGPAGGTGGVSSGSGGSAPGSGGGLMGSGGAVQGGGGTAPGTGGVVDGGGGAQMAGSGCDSADLVCLDFEDYAAGATLSGTPFDDSVMCYDPGYSRTAEAGAGVNGSQALVTSGASTSANTCALVYDLGEVSDFWVTAHIKILGTSPDAEHEVTFFELGELANVDDPELRIGYRGDSSCSNSGAAYQGFELGATKGLANGEDTGCTGSKTNDGIPVADEWYCIEVHVTQGGGQLMADMFINGDDQDYLLHSSPVTEIGGAFEARYLKIGQQSYSGSFESVVIDNLSVSTSQVGCGI